MSHKALELILCTSSENCEYRSGVLNDICNRQDFQNCSSAVRRDEEGGCSCCQGDEALFWQDDMGVFVHENGDMMITIQGKEMHFRVNCCPNCGIKFSSHK